MVSSTSSQVHDVKDAPSEAPSPSALRKRRLIGLGIWLVLFVCSWIFFGLPATDPLQAFVWLAAAAIIWRSHLGWRSHLAFARDWIPVLVLLEAYNYSRGFADNNIKPHATAMIHADVFLVGKLTGGEVPTVWLQQHFYHASHLYIWDVLASWIYFTHFVTLPALALIFWLKNKDLWRKLTRRWFTLTAAGLVTFYLYPAAPPWWAAEHGLIAPVARISTRGWKAIGLHGTGNLLHTGQLAANPVAAMPSLHSAYSMLVAISLFSVIASRWRYAIWLYPLLMALTLLYSGEHYLIDVLMGWIYAVVSCVVADRYGRWRDARRAAGEQPVNETVLAPAQPTPAD